ncbi:MAG: gfo/Idh/MocA family oxidoreductase, partial [Planctomycetota bacterium]
LFVGDRGSMVATYGNHTFHGGAKSVEIPAEHKIAPSVGHHIEWLSAIQSNDPTRPLCKFDYAGPLTETVLLGCAAHVAGTAIEYDGQSGALIGQDANQTLLTKSRRDGWPVAP